MVLATNNLSRPDKQPGRSFMWVLQGQVSGVRVCKSIFALQAITKKSRFRRGLHTARNTFSWWGAILGSRPRLDDWVACGEAIPISSGPAWSSPSNRASTTELPAASDTVLITEDEVEVLTYYTRDLESLTIFV